MGLLEFFKPKSSGFGRASVSQQTEAAIKGDWANIDILIGQKGPSQLRQALITADKTLDAALKDSVAGENMGERLKNVKDKFEWSAYDKLWKAHKMRNSMVHEAGFEPPHFAVTEAIETLRASLITLGVRV